MWVERRKGRETCLYNNSPGSHVLEHGCSGRREGEKRSTAQVLGGALGEKVINLSKGLSLIFHRDLKMKWGVKIDFMGRVHK